jgi:hypothetical protein
VRGGCEPDVPAELAGEVAVGTVIVAELTSVTPCQPPSMPPLWIIETRVHTSLSQIASEDALIAAMSALEHVARMQVPILWM